MYAVNKMKENLLLKRKKINKIFVMIERKLENITHNKRKENEDDRSKVYFNVNKSVNIVNMLSKIKN